MIMFMYAIICFNLHSANNYINNNLIKIQKYNLKYSKYSNNLAINMNNNYNENEEINNTFINNNINNKLNNKIYNINFKLNIELNNSNNLDKSFNNYEIYDDDEIYDKEINNSFPSFYDFLKKREILEINSKKIYLDNFNQTNALIKKSISKEIEKNDKLKKYKKYKKFKEKYNEIINEKYNEKNNYIFFKDIKLLTSIAACEWARTWIYEMVHVPDYFPTFMYQDMFKMRDFGSKNNSKEYFYIGYYPEDVNLKYGPYYIAAFELVPKMRELQTYIIVQNPHYCIDTIYDEVKIKNFKKEIQALSNDAYVFFKYDNLKSMSNERYYYSWLYN